MRNELLLSIVRAYYKGADIRPLVLMAAARIKNPEIQAELKNLASQPTPIALTQLPIDIQAMVQPPLEVTRRDLVIPASVNAELEALLQEHVATEELKAHQLMPRSRILFHGPPGCGKTSVACALARELGSYPLWISLPAVIGSYMGESSKKVDRLFQALKPGYSLVLDELDSVGTVRGPESSAASQERNYTLNTMLTCLDRSRAGVLFATTNRMDLIDPALVRRFDVVLEFPAPSREEQQRLIEMLEARYQAGKLGVKARSKATFDSITKEAQRAARNIVLGRPRAPEGEK